MTLVSQMHNTWSDPSFSNLLPTCKGFPTRSVQLKINYWMQLFRKVFSSSAENSVVCDELSCNYSSDVTLIQFISQILISFQLNWKNTHIFRRGLNLDGFRMKTRTNWGLSFDYVWLAAAAGGFLYFASRKFPLQRAVYNLDVFPFIPATFRRAYEIQR